MVDWCKKEKSFFVCGGSLGIGMTILPMQLEHNSFWNLLGGGVCLREDLPKFAGKVGGGVPHGRVQNAKLPHLPNVFVV